MDYFKINAKDRGIYIHFFNRGWSIYWSESKPNLLKELGVDPMDFVDKSNSLLAKYQIKIPDDYPKHSTLEKDVNDFPINDFLLCIHCCVVMEEKYHIDTSKILRWELIKPNSNRGIHHACSIAVIALYYLEKGFKLIIPLEKKNKKNPDLIINDLMCEIKTIQESDWSKEIDLETGFGKEKSNGPDLCYDMGTFIAKKNSGYKGILQGQVIFADLSLKSFRSTFDTLEFYGHGDLLENGLPEPQKCRIIFFSRINLKCIGYYIDFQPNLWKIVRIASAMSYQRAVLKLTIPGDGKPHKVELPEPPENKK